MEKEQQSETSCPFCGGQTETGWVAGGPRSLSWIPGGKGLLGKWFGWPFAEKIGESGFRDMTIPRMVGIMLCTVPLSVCCGSTDCVSQSNEMVKTGLHLNATSAGVDTLTQHIASVPWGTMRAYEAANTNEADLIITVSYGKKDVVFDKDVIPVKISDKSFPDNHLMIHRVKCRDNWSKNIWCRGAANLTKVDQDGFVINLGLSWGGVTQGNLNEKFICSWKTHQEFLKDGFTITVQTMKHGTR